MERHAATDNVAFADLRPQDRLWDGSSDGWRLIGRDDDRPRRRRGYDVGGIAFLLVTGFGAVLVVGVGHGAPGAGKRGESR